MAIFYDGFEVENSHFASQLVEDSLLATNLKKLNGTVVIAKDKLEAEDTFSEAGRDSIGESMDLMENFGKSHMKSASETTLSEEEVEKLKALGYID